MKPTAMPTLPFSRERGSFLRHSSSFLLYPSSGKLSTLELRDEIQQVRRFPVAIPPALRERYEHPGIDELFDRLVYPTLRTLRDRLHHRSGNHGIRRQEIDHRPRGRIRTRHPLAVAELLPPPFLQPANGVHICACELADTELHPLHFRGCNRLGSQEQTAKWRSRRSAFVIQLSNLVLGLGYHPHQLGIQVHIERRHLVRNLRVVVTCAFVARRGVGRRDVPPGPSNHVARRRRLSRGREGSGTKRVS